MEDLESDGIVANVERPATCKSACSSTIVREGDKCKYFDMTVGEIIDKSEFCEEGTVCNEKGGGGMVSIGGGPFFICEVANGVEAEWCKGSPAQSCRMRCAYDKPTCQEKSECAMRISPTGGGMACCDYECQGGGDGGTTPVTVGEGERCNAEKLVTCNAKGLVCMKGGVFSADGWGECTAVAEETPAPTTATATTVPATASTTAVKGSWTTMHGYIVDKLCASKGKGSKNPDGIDVFAAPEKHSLNCL